MNGDLDAADVAVSPRTPLLSRQARSPGGRRAIALPDDQRRCRVEDQVSGGMPARLTSTAGMRPASDLDVGARSRGEPLVEQREQQRESCRAARSPRISSATGGGCSRAPRASLHPEAPLWNTWTSGPAGVFDSTAKRARDTGWT